MQVARIDGLEEALRTNGLQTRSEPGRLVAWAGSGPRRREAGLSLDALDALLRTRPLADRRAAVASFARGVAAWLNEPANQKLAEGPFTEAAGAIVATLEGPLFADGFIAAGGGPPFAIPFAPGVNIVHAIELDDGMKTITMSLLDRWAVHPERVEKAAVSILYYKTSWGQAEPVDGARVQRWAIGDGFDAARALLLDALDYHRARRGIAFSIPSSDTLLVADLDDASVDDLRRLTRAAWDDAELPLSPEIFAIRDARRDLVPLDARTPS